LALLRARLHALQTALDFCERREIEEQSGGARKRAEEEAILLKPLDAAKSGLSRVIAELSEMVKHLERRKDLPASRLRRLKIVSNELFAGNYFRYSKGFGSAIRDLIESF
jgi:hypothetical protein